jgi:lysozyme
MTLRKQIERDEGKRNRGYKCPAGYWTIGVGYNVENGPPLPDAIIDQITDYLIEYFTLELMDALPWVHYLDEVRRNALINMAFNLGIEGLLKFERTLKAIQDGRYDDAASHLLDSKYARQVGDRAKRLAKQLQTGVMQ